MFVSLGFDQIPQFSLESMEYHGSEAWNWICDIISGFVGGVVDAISLAPLPLQHHRGSHSPPTVLQHPTPASHHAQVQGTNIDPADVIGPAPMGRGLGGAAGTGGFVQP